MHKLYELFGIHGLFKLYEIFDCATCTKRENGAGNRPEPKLLKTQLGQAFGSSFTKGDATSICHVSIRRQIP